MKRILFLACMLFSSFTFYSCDKDDDEKQTSESYCDLFLYCKYIEIGDEEFVLTTPGLYTTAGDSYPTSINYINDKYQIWEYGSVRLEGDSIYTGEIFDISRIDLCSYKITFHKNPNKKDYHECMLGFLSVYKSWCYDMSFEYVDGKWTPIMPDYCYIDDAYTADSSTRVFFGRIIPYEPVSEQDVPEWLREKIHNHDKYYFRICKGTLKGETVYHITTSFAEDAAFYDKDGNEIEIYDRIHTNMDFMDFISQYEDVVCIYYHRYCSNE